MAHGNTNVDTQVLGSVGNNFTSVANYVREIFTYMQNTINQVTSNSSWKGAASDAFLEKFNNIKPRLETHLQQLESLGPTVGKVSSGYEDTEAENVAMIRS